MITFILLNTALTGSADCGGPFDLWEPNSTFSSPNYPHSYGNKAACEYNLQSGLILNTGKLLTHDLDFYRNSYLKGSN